jgi:hypothetical protein
MKKASVRFILDRSYGNYTARSDTTIEMCILGKFLASDVRSSALSFKEWLLDETQTFTGGNITNIEKEGNDVLLNDQYSEQPDGGPYFRIPKREFINLLDEWEKICKEKPQEVLVEWDGKCFVVETKQ